MKGAGPNNLAFVVDVPTGMWLDEPMNNAEQTHNTINHYEGRGWTFECSTLDGLVFWNVTKSGRINFRVTEADGNVTRKASFDDDAFGRKLLTQALTMVGAA